MTRTQRNTIEKVQVLTMERIPLIGGVDSWWLVTPYLGTLTLPELISNPVFISLGQALPSLEFCGIQKLQAYKIPSQQSQWKTNSSFPESQNNSDDNDNNTIRSCLGSV